MLYDVGCICVMVDKPAIDSNYNAVLF